jgi:hypothetical protein
MPGVGLLLLRILSSGGLADQSRRILCGLLIAPETKSGTLAEVAAVSVLLASILIIIGLWTTVAAGVAPAAVLVYVGLGFAQPDSILFASLCIVVVLLGPGAWSFDARLFGWRQIRFPDASQRSGKH